ncbi:MAG: hypothetical protein RR207_05995 [Clostridia bacterium]
MKMTILELSYGNIRKINDLIISFEKGSKPIKNTFIMMSNGTGKTTTMELIKGIFDGTANNWSTTKVKSYKPIANEAVYGNFSIKVKFDEKIYKYFLDLNYETGVANVSSSTTAESGGGKENQRHFPMEVQDLFNENFVRRFVFDGEQATKVLDNTSNEAEEAIKYLYGLDAFDSMLTENDKILQEFQLKNDAGSKGTDQSLTNIRTRKKKVDEIITLLEVQARDKKVELGKKTSEKETVESKIIEINKNFTELNSEKNNIEKAKESCRAEIELCINELITNMRSPYLVSQVFSKSMLELAANMTKLKLPKTISREFFRELANDQVCICGRHIGVEEKQAILDNADTYLGEDQQFILNSIKSSLVNSEYSDTLVVGFEKMKKLLIKENSLETRLRNVNAKLEKEGGEEASALNKQKEQIVIDIQDLTNNLEIIQSNNDFDQRLNDQNNLKKARAEQKKYEEKIAAITQTNNNLKRKNKFETYIKDLTKLTNIGLKKDIIKKANEKISSVITDDFIEIEAIEKYIKLKSKGGASVGQTLSIAFCYICTLFEDSELKFPFVIDSPVNSMDKEKRRAVADIIPQIFNQMICFVMSTEVKDFAERFYSREDSQFITIESKSDSVNPTVNYDIEYFDSYQDETEVVEYAF